MKQKVSLVLSGGGARGLAHIGVIEVLEENGFDIQSVTGTSMGALIGGIYAANKLPEVKEWFCNLDTKQILKLIDFSFSRKGLLKGEKIFDKLESFIPKGSKIEDLPVHYRAIAADITNQKEIIWKKGDLHTAIRSSIAIPTVFTPVEYNNALLVDGGIFNNLPLNHAERSPDDILIAVNVNANIPVLEIEKKTKEDKEYKKKLKDFNQIVFNLIPKKEREEVGYFGLINKVFTSIFNHTGQLWIKEYNPELVIDIAHKSCNTFDFLKAKEQIEQGRIATERALKERKL